MPSLLANDKSQRKRERFSPNRSGNRFFDCRRDYETHFFYLSSWLIRAGSAYGQALSLELSSWNFPRGDQSLHKTDRFPSSQ